MQPEYTDKVAEMGCGDSGKVHGGDLLSNTGGQRGVSLGGEIFQVLGGGSYISQTSTGQQFAGTSGGRDKFGDGFGSF